MRLESVHITNFRLLDDVSLEFSTDPNKPMTVVRAENGSGKTSILYALRWAMHGEPGIPPGMRLTSTARPAHQPVQVQVRVEFTTTDPFSGAEARYRLFRTCEETPGEGNQYTRSPSQLRLLRRTDRGEEDIEEGKEGLISAILPLNLVDVFFTNGDDVQRFIGGGHRGDRERQDAVHRAIRQLLGLQSVETMISHIGAAGRNLKREAHPRAGQELQTALDDLDQIEEELGKRKENLSVIAQRRDAVGQQIRDDERMLDGIKGIGDLDAIQARIRAIEEDLRHLDAEDVNIRRKMKEFLRSEVLSADVLKPQLERGLAVLGELVDRRVIPGTSLEVLTDRLELGLCICGLNLESGDARYNHVLGLIDEQKLVAPQLQRLTALLHEARNSAYSPDGEDGEYETARDVAITVGGEFIECLDHKRRKRADLTAEQERRRQIDAQRIQELTERLRSNRLKHAEYERNYGSVRGEIEGLEERQLGCRKRYETAEQREAQSQRLRRQSIVANDLLALTEGTLERLKSEYVRQVSSRMNELFLNIVGADPDSETSIFTKVAIEETTYDIVIHTLEGRTFDADTELNGASQRALTLSFIWSLMEVAQRESPRIIDTPLGMTSGQVKHRMVDLLTRPISVDDVPHQAILFMTRSEIRDIEALIQNRAGTVSTLTCSKDYPVDLVNDWSGGAVVIKACQCNHAQVCGICERKTDSGRFVMREA